MGLRGPGEPRALQRLARGCSGGRGWDSLEGRYASASPQRGVFRSTVWPPRLGDHPAGRAGQGGGPGCLVGTSLACPELAGRHAATLASVTQGFSAPIPPALPCPPCAPGQTWTSVRWGTCASTPAGTPRAATSASAPRATASSPAGRTARVRGCPGWGLPDATAARGARRGASWEGASLTQPPVSNPFPTISCGGGAGSRAQRG